MVFLFIMWIILIITLIIVTAKLEINIENLVITSQSKEHIPTGYNIIIMLKIIGNVPIIKFTITKNKLKKIQESLKRNEKIRRFQKDIWQNKDKIDIKIFKGIKEFSKYIYIKKLDLGIKLGTENAFLTSMLVVCFSSLLSIGFSKTSIKEKNIEYVVKPIYRNQNYIKIEISGIFQIKVIHIINTMYVLNKKGGMKNNERTSNRRSYDYSYE